MSTSAPASEDAVEFRYAIDDRSISFSMEEELYPRDAVYGAAYLFVDRCFVFLSRPSEKEGVVVVQLRSKAATSREALDALAGEFANELLNQVLRQRVGDSTSKIREYYMARAFFNTGTPATIDDLLKELDREELEQGELEIPVPWMDNAAPKVDASGGASG